ncbi:MAG TPA: MerR family transcriptional regulator [Motilibacterales bacterium]|nr:MerR family transcriptional regulator [Motilibacterales bacterium]
MEEVVVMEYGIAEVARLAGTTSRTLRHYGDVGLLVPSRVGANGYRYYDTTALTRLQRILMLRQLGLGVAAIGEVLEAADDTAALRAHLEWLVAESDRLDRQIASVERTLTSIEKGEPIMASDMLDGFDHAQYRDEVEQRWGAQAYADSDRWWRGLTTQGQQAFMDEHVALAEAWADLRSAGAPVASPEAQALAARHRAWIAAGWGKRPPTADQLAGLAEMYVADERFAANYGGTEGAIYVRDALTHFAITELA